MNETMTGQWKCPKCERKFEKTNQSHSCNVFPIKQHFKGKGELSGALYNDLKEKIMKGVGAFEVDSIPCCIHLVFRSIFAAVFVMKNRIRVSFTLDHELESPRIYKCARYSASRFIHQVDITNKSQIDKELLGWISQAYHLRKKKIAKN